VSDIAGEFAEGGSDAVGAFGLDQANGEAAQAGDVLRAVSGAQGAAVFVPVPVEEVVVAVDAPMGTVECQESRGRGRLRGVAGQAVDGFDGGLAGLFLDGLALDGKGLADAGEVQIAVEPGRGRESSGIPGARGPE
jgi:hypothetical protein